MCWTDVITYSCDHASDVTVHCHDANESGQQCEVLQSWPSPSPKSNRECPDCMQERGEDSDIEHIISRIATDPSLAPVVPTTSRDPSAPKLYFKSKQVFAICGHPWEPRHTDIERDQDDPEWIEEHQPGSCYSCCFVNAREIQRMKDNGKWGEDPWKVMEAFEAGQVHQDDISGPSWTKDPEISLPDVDAGSESHHILDDSMDPTPYKNKGTANAEEPEFKEYNDDDLYEGSPPGGSDAPAYQTLPPGGLPTYVGIPPRDHQG